MPAPEKVKELVERFENHREAYRSGRYNETQLRNEFLNPFFEALGWDVYNKQGYAESYKDVIHEATLDVEGENKAPDYAFRIGGMRKFFVEAKKPSVRIETDIHPAFQLRRYAWSAKLPLSILTDFEEFAVYDCRAKPDKTDKASVGRVALYSFRDYIEKWEEIAARFSREAVLKGSFDQYAEGLKGKKGTTEVDDAFLEEIEHWRDLLAKNIAIRNPKLSVHELNFAVQMTLDRIIFLRICEDRGVEVEEQLKAIGRDSEIYSGLCQLFKKADARYNSGLFHFKDEKVQSSGADSLTQKLKVDDKVLHEILANLYYPESPYVFKEIPSDILGQVYERFLGKVIRLTAGHQAKVEEKPEVRKAGGVYYTPTYIVQYIVQNTVGKLLEGKTPKEAARLKILDPACGSGTFPLGAYQYLLDWHLKWYTENGPEKWATGKQPAIFQIKDGYHLTTAKKKEILLNNIFGVDIDAQAVEVTKLTLLLKVLEGESSETIGSQLALFQERVLPDLGRNIKCGNSLIGPDYYQGRQLTMMIDEEERYRVNVFDWKAEFPQVFVQGGFDVVIGNPPYVRQEVISDLKSYLQAHYKVFSGTSDLYAYFIELSLRITKLGGKFSYIVSSKFVRSGYGELLRRFIPAHSILELFLDFGDLPVFEGATVYPCIFVLEKETDTSKQDTNKITFCNIKTLDFSNLEDYIHENSFVIPQINLKNGSWQLHPAVQQELLKKISNAGETLSQYLGSEPLRGVLTGLNEVFIVPDNRINQITKGNNNERDIFLPYLRGRNVGRYTYKYMGENLLFSEGITEASHPNVMSYMSVHREALEARTDIQGTSKKWYELRPCNYYDLLRKPKIIYASVAQQGTFVLDEKGSFIDKTCYFLPSQDKYLLGLLNSKLLFYYFSRIAVQRRGGYFEYLTIYVSKLPIHTVDFSESADKMQHDKVVSLVERMLDLHKKVPKTPQEQEMVKREIESTDKQIDNLVYELYGLTEEEIKVVEGE